MYALYELFNICDVFYKKASFEWVDKAQAIKKYFELFYKESSNIDFISSSNSSKEVDDKIKKYANEKFEEWKDLNFDTLSDIDARYDVEYLSSGSGGDAYIIIPKQLNKNKDIKFKYVLKLYPGMSNMDYEGSVEHEVWKNYEDSANALYNVDNQLTNNDNAKTKNKYFENYKNEVFILKNKLFENKEMSYPPIAYVIMEYLDVNYNYIGGKKIKNDKVVEGDPFYKADKDNYLKKNDKGKFETEQEFHPKIPFDTSDIAKKVFLNPSFKSNIFRPVMKYLTMENENPNRIISIHEAIEKLNLEPTIRQFAKSIEPEIKSNIYISHNIGSLYDALIAKQNIKSQISGFTNYMTRKYNKPNWLEDLIYGICLEILKNRNDLKADNIGIRPDTGDFVFFDSLFPGIIADTNHEDRVRMFHNLHVNQDINRQVNKSNVEEARDSEWGKPLNIHEEETPYVLPPPLAPSPSPNPVSVSDVVKKVEEKYPNIKEENNISQNITRNIA